MFQRLISIICCLIALNAYSVISESDDSPYRTKPLSRVDLSNDTILRRILEEVADNIGCDDPSAIHTVDMSKYKDGTLIRICRLKEAVLDPRPSPFGYTVVNNSMFVFNLTFDHCFSLAASRDTIQVQIGIPDNISDMPDIKYYCLWDSIYAKYVPEVGWIWSDGRPDE